MFFLLSPIADDDDETPTVSEGWTLAVSATPPAFAEVDTAAPIAWSMVAEVAPALWTTVPDTTGAWSLGA